MKPEIKVVKSACEGFFEVMVQTANDILHCNCLFTSIYPYRLSSIIEWPVSFKSVLAAPNIGPKLKCNINF